MTRRWAAPAVILFLTASACFADTLQREKAAVEKVRGRKFVSDVKVVNIERASLSGHIEKQMEKGLPYSVDDWGRILRALQLVDVQTKEVVPKLLALYESQVLAFYDPDTHTYYAIDKFPPALAEQAKIVDPKVLEEMVQVHELMHAMQDQHWNIGVRDKALKADTDANLAYHALLEGEAVLVMLANMLSTMGVTLDDVIKDDAMVNTMLNAAKTEQSMVDPSAPKYFTEMLKFPYLDGLSFVVAAYRRGGWKELDRIHANPPGSTREILHPEDYFSGKFKPQPFDNKKPDGALTVEHLGEFHWAYLAGAENARGWVGDRVVVMKNGRVDVETKWDTAEQANKFAAAYGTFLKGRGLDAAFTKENAVVKVSYQAK